MEDWSGDPAHRQTTATVRCEWGLRGAEAITVGADIAVVVDVLSFTTTLSVALDAGMTVLPYRWRDDTARTWARDHAARLAIGRAEQEPGQISLSPGSIRRAGTVRGERLVLPSPNGSAISFALATRVPVVIGASLRNASAVVAWLTATNPTHEATIAVIPAGERWDDGSLRPAIEDLWGAGAVIAGLQAAGWTSLSPEAEVAADAFAAVRDRLPACLRTCASGRELIERGFGEDVAIATEMDSSNAVPLLQGVAYIDASAA
ncbi:MAG: 2-phosphosulfolactate phosphatase [Thermomicrobiales bacterium]